MIATPPLSPLADTRRRVSPGAEVPDLDFSVILSFDVEDHHRIEAAAGLEVDPGLKDHYGARLEYSTRWILEQLGGLGIQATFFVVGEICERQPRLVRAIQQAGHEVGSHSWDHRRVQDFTPATFAEDVRRSKDALEQTIGQAVVGYRAPTFSIVRSTAWAIDVLAELGMEYDSSIYPVRHDRYGVPRAPRIPFFAHGNERSILEMPPATLRLFGLNLPVGGGGYFRLLPRFLLDWGLRQVKRRGRPAVAMLYFHPWEFDPAQARLPLGPISRFRTYVGIDKSQARLQALLKRGGFSRAVDVARALARQAESIPHFKLAA